jgi:cytochrome c-type biogenesis protein CcmH/NrfG
MAGSRDPLLRSRLLVVGLWFTAILGVVGWSVMQSTAPAGPTDLEKVQALRSQGRPREAAALLAGVLASQPQDAGLWTVRGYVELDLKKTTLARQSFERALALKPGDPEALLGVASSLVQDGDRPAAGKALDALGDRVLDPNQRHRVAQMEAMIGRPERALVHLQTLIQERPEDRGLLREIISAAEATQDWNTSLSSAKKGVGLAGTPTEREEFQTHVALAERNIAEANPLLAPKATPSPAGRRDQ